MSVYATCKDMQRRAAAGESACGAPCHQPRKSLCLYDASRHPQRKTKSLKEPSAAITGAAVGAAAAAAASIHDALRSMRWITSSRTKLSRRGGDKTNKRLSTTPSVSCAANIGASRTQTLRVCFSTFTSQMTHGRFNSSRYVKQGYKATAVTATAGTKPAES